MDSLELAAHAHAEGTDGTDGARTASASSSPSSSSSSSSDVNRVDAHKAYESDATIFGGRSNHPDSRSADDDGGGGENDGDDGDGNSGVNQDPEAKSNSREELLFSKLEGTLADQGMTLFSRKIAIGYIKKTLASKQGMNSFSRVISHLVNNMNNKIVQPKYFRVKSTSKATSVDVSSTTTTEKDDIVSELGPAKFVKEEEQGCESDTLIRNWQSGCPEIIPGLRAIPVWTSDQLPWILELQQRVSVIKEEVMAYRRKNVNENASKKSIFQPYRAPHHQDSSMDTYNSSSSSSSSSSKEIEGGRGGDHSASTPSVAGHSATSSGNWNVCYLSLHGIDFEENIAHFPQTMDIIRSVVPRYYNHSFLSALSAGTHVISHHGPTNKKLRCHIPLVVSGPAWLRVAERKVMLQEGKVVVFDDSFEHEACNEAESPRIVLVIDLWHPDLSDIEVKFLEFCTKCQMTAAKRIYNMSRASKTTTTEEVVGSNDKIDEDTAEKVERGGGGGGEGGDFLSVIMNTRKANIKIPDEQIWGYRVVDD